MVNDLGGAIDGAGSDAGPADDVAAEITAAGGAAVADTNDVSTAEGGQAMIDAAITAFGRIDIVVNNAGIVKWAGPLDCDIDNVWNHLAVHTVGSFNTTRAAWPHLVEQDYGRVVMTTSTGMFGLPDNLAYATAKAAVIGMARSLTAAAGKRNIRVNVVAPAAFTRMAGHPAAPTPDDVAEQLAAQMAPEQVAPMVAYLAHERCAVSGEVYSAGAGHFARIFIAETPGYADPGLRPTVEDVGEHWDEINDEAGYYVPASLLDWAAHFMAPR